MLYQNCILLLHIVTDSYHYYDKSVLCYINTGIKADKCVAEMHMSVTIATVFKLLYLTCRCQFIAVTVTFLHVHVAVLMFLNEYLKCVI